MITLKWPKLAGIGRRTISLPRVSSRQCQRHPAQKGHFVVYSSDRKRFVVPLRCMHGNIFRELFRMSEEVFGLPTEGPITIPLDATFLEYVLSFSQRRLSEELEKALLLSLSASQCSPSQLGLNCLRHESETICTLEAGGGHSFVIKYMEGSLQVDEIAKEVR